MITPVHLDRPARLARLVRLARLLLTILSVQPLQAQIRASERSTLTQTIDGTVITIDYARPKLRGRAPIFGKVVKWDEVWTPGANWATTLETSKPVTLNGHPLAKGRYSVWLVVRKTGDWTLVLDPDHHRFHMDPPDSNATQVRFAVQPLPGPATDVLTWSFPRIEVGGGAIALQWAESRILLDLKVTPSYTITMSPEEAEPLVGRYSFSWVVEPGQKADTMELVLTYEKGSLYAHFVPNDDYMGRFVMIRIAGGTVIPGLFEKGEIYEVIREEVYEFKGPKGRADGFEVRDEQDKLIATGKRLP